MLQLLRDPFHERMRRVSKPIIATAMTRAISPQAAWCWRQQHFCAWACKAPARRGISESKVGRGSPWGVPMLCRCCRSPSSLELMFTGEMIPG